METIVVIAIIVLGLIVLLRILKAVSQSRRRKQLVAEAEDFIEHVRQNQGLASCPTNVMLKKGEAAFYSAPCELYETRAVRHYESGHTGLRLAKGVYIGGSRGRSISSQEWAHIDTGKLTITNKRLIFDGGHADRTYALSRVVAAQASLDGIEVSLEGRQKSMVFTAGNPLIVAAIFQICCRTEDPADLSQMVLDFTFA